MRARRILSFIGHQTLARRCAVLPTASLHEDTLAKVAKRIPAGGMTGAQLQALMEDEHPEVAHSMLAGSGSSSSSSNSLLQAVLDRPDVFAVEQGAEGKWHVRQRGAAAKDGQPTMSEASLPSPPPSSSSSSQAAEEYQRVVKYCSRRLRSGSFIPLEDACLQCGVSSPSGVIDIILDGKQKLLDVKMSVKIRPKRALRAAIVFVDGDELSAVAVDQLCDELNLIKEECTMHIYRRPNTIALSDVDVVTVAGVPTTLCIEKKARELRYRTPVVLRDVIYMCSARLFQTYASHIAPLNSFPDANVYVCSPSRIQVVCEKQVIPYCQR